MTLSTVSPVTDVRRTRMGDAASHVPEYSHWFWVDRRRGTHGPPGATWADTASSGTAWLAATRANHHALEATILYWKGVLPTSQGTANHSACG